jgi:hypothetical protein
LRPWRERAGDKRPNRPSAQSRKPTAETHCPSSEMSSMAGAIHSILQIPLHRQRESAHWRVKKSPAECGAGVRGRGLAYLALFGRFSFKTNVFGHTPFGSASSFSSADYCERGSRVPAMFGVGVAPAHEEPRSGSSSSAHESTSGRSTNYGSGHPTPVFRGIGRIVS